MKRPNGSGTVFYRKDKKRYCACVQTYDPYRRQMCRFFERKKDALAALPGMREELLHSGIKKEAPTVRSLWEEYSTAGMLKLSKSKQIDFKTAYKRLEPIENAVVSELQTKRLQSLLEGLNYYPARNVKNLLGHLFDIALANQDATVNLAKYLVLPDLEEKEAEPWNAEEISKMWEAFNNGDEMAADFLLMIYTGMMPGELLGCRVDQIDFEHQRIVGAGIKTNERRKRSIMLPDAIIPVVRKLSEGREKLVTLTRGAWYKEYKEFVKRVGIRDLPPYSCRHTTATVLALGDSNPLLITRVMRQATPLITERYKHADEQTVLDELNKIQAR